MLEDGRLFRESRPNDDGRGQRGGQRQVSSPSKRESRFATSNREAHNVSPSIRLASSRSISEAHASLRQNLENMASQLERSWRAWNAMHACIEKLEAEMCRADRIEAESEALQDQFMRLQRSHERVLGDLEHRTTDVTQMSRRILSLEAELDQERLGLAQALSQAETASAPRRR